MPVTRNQILASAFNKAAVLPYELRLEDFKLALQDVYDFFFDVNSHLVGKGLDRLDDMLRPAIMSGVLSDIWNEDSDLACQRHCEASAELDL